MAVVRPLSLSFSWLGQARRRRCSSVSLAGKPELLDVASEEWELRPQKEQLRQAVIRVRKQHKTPTAMLAHCVCLLAVCVRARECVRLLNCIPARLCFHTKQSAA